MSKPFDIVALAEAINRRREEYNALHPDCPARVTPQLSRILENAASYTPYRQRKAARGRHAAENPTIATVVTIANTLNTTVGNLLGERAYRITEEDRRKVRAIVEYLTRLFELDRMSD